MSELVSETAGNNQAINGLRQAIKPDFGCLDGVGRRFGGFIAFKCLPQKGTNCRQKDQQNQDFRHLMPYCLYCLHSHETLPPIAREKAKTPFRGVVA